MKRHLDAWTCQECNLTYNNHYDYIKHKENHNLFCFCCQEQLSNRWNWLRHLETKKHKGITCCILRYIAYLGIKGNADTNELEKPFFERIDPFSNDNNDNNENRNSNEEPQQFPGTECIIKLLY